MAWPDDYYGGSCDYPSTGNERYEEFLELDAWDAANADLRGDSDEDA